MVYEIAVLYFLFFCSGAAGLIYQVVWVRVFGTVFGNTLYSASIVIAIFMLGLGVGSYIAGRWADRRYAALIQAGAGGSATLVRAYGVVELVIAVLGLGISALLPHLAQLSALTSAYAVDASGWHVLSTSSYVARTAIAAALLGPVTLLMGGTLTLLIRHLVRTDFTAGGWRIAALYAANTLGAALGALMTDVALVPTVGLYATQLVAVALNAAAGVGALYLARATPVRLTASAEATAVRKADATIARRPPVGREPDARGVRRQPDRAPAFTAVALALTGFAAMGMEILWFRHFSILLGEFRAVLSLLLTIILVGIGVGSLAGGFVHRRTARPAEWLMVVQGLFVVATLFGLAAADAESIRRAGLAHAAGQAAMGGVTGRWTQTLGELWFNARPMLVELAVPALLMGFAFPLGNGVVQRVERLVGRRAGLLYLANTLGAVCGAVASGFLLLPALGMQGAAAVLTAAAAFAIVPLHYASRTRVLAAAGSLLPASAALALWVSLPSNFLIARALLAPADQILTVSEGVTEVIAVADVPNRGRLLLTNGHPMSSTSLLSQRYMRALAHIPLLSMENPEAVLVLCFGIGNTAHAATLHPSVERVEVVDTSRHVLTHAGYFRDANQDVLRDPRVAVYVNDGRHHLQMQREPAYDLITLEPPPVAHAGVGALYSREFYALARTRLKPGGYLSQWLPVSQVPLETNLAMIRAFIDVFPASVLLSGAYADLLLVGTNAPRIELDPDRVAAALAHAPAVQADLERLALGSIREIAGSFVASAGALAEATRLVTPVSDDRPLQEYSVNSLLKFRQASVEAFADVTGIAVWCPRCFVNGQPAPSVEGLDAYLALLDLAYRAPPAASQATDTAAGAPPRALGGSAYLGAVVPESPDVPRLAAAIEPERGGPDAPTRAAGARYTQATALLETGRFREAIDQFRAVLQLAPEAVEARNNLGVALASLGRLDEAIEQFQQALAIRPDFADARRNLALALEKRKTPR